MKDYWRALKRLIKKNILIFQKDSILYPYRMLFYFITIKKCKLADEN